MRRAASIPGGHWEAGKRDSMRRPAFARSKSLGEGAGLAEFTTSREVAGRAWKGASRGQRQKCSRLRFTGQDARSTSPTGAAAQAEIRHWRWEPDEEPPSAIVRFKRPVYGAW